MKGKITKNEEKKQADVSITFDRLLMNIDKMLELLLS